VTVNKFQLQYVTKFLPQSGRKYKKMVAQVNVEAPTQTKFSHSEDGGSTLLWNTGTNPLYYMV